MRPDGRSKHLCGRRARPLGEVNLYPPTGMGGPRLCGIPNPDKGDLKNFSRFSYGLHELFVELKAVEHLADSAILQGQKAQVRRFRHENHKNHVDGTRFCSLTNLHSP